MILTLTLTDFRNHKFCRISTGGTKNIIITGPNGSGKTAIIEAVSILGGARGLRGAAFADIARFGGNGGFSSFAQTSDDTELVVYFNAGDANRRARINGANATLADLAAHLRIVWLTPKEDRLFVDSASDRRDFFDRLVSSFDTSHLGRIARLSRLLSERGFALKNRADDNWLRGIELQIAAIAVSVAAARIKYASELNYFLTNAAVSVSGMIESMILNSGSADAESQYIDYLSQNRELVGDKMVIDGPHKSDFGVFNSTLNLPANLTSTGQQKSVLVDLILAHAKLVRTKTAQTPIVLLDEATAHLDVGARCRMFQELAAADAQVWATGIDPDIFSDIADATFVACHDGEISNIIQS